MTTLVVHTVAAAAPQTEFGMGHPLYVLGQAYNGAWPPSALPP